MDRKLLNSDAMMPAAQLANGVHLRWTPPPSRSRASTLSPTAVLCVAILSCVLSSIVSCAAPTLPLPPPDLPTVTDGLTADTVHLTSIRGAQPNAVIVVFNNSPAVPREKRVGGAQADGAGSWDTEIFATAGDCLQITQEERGEQSTPLFFCLPPK